MALMRITPSQVRQKASELRDMNSQFKAKAESLGTSEEVLEAKWEGDAKAAFRASFQKDRVNMDNFYRAIEQYCTTLDSIAVMMDNADKQSAEIAGQ